MDFKPQIETLLKTLKSKGVERAKIEEDLGYSENYIDQMLAKGGNKRFLIALQKYVLQKTTPAPTPANGAQHPADALTGAHVTLQDYINKIEQHNVFLQYVIKSGLVSLESNLKTGQHQIQEQLFAVGESLGNQLEGVSLGLAALAKDRDVVKKDKDISGRQRGSDGKDKSRS